MLRFTDEQQAFVLANRRQFNASQIAMAENHGQTLIGNALPLPKDVWGLWDREAVEVQRTTLRVFMTFRRRIMPMQSAAGHTSNRV